MYDSRRLATDVYAVNVNNSADHNRERADKARLRFETATRTRRALEQQRYDAQCARLRASMRLP